MKKPIKDTKLGKFLTEKAPKVLDVIDDYFPPVKILTALVEKDLSPEDKFELEKLFAAHEKEMAALEVVDMDSARKREVEYVKSLGHVDWMQIFVGAILMLSFLASLIIISFKEIPLRNEHIMLNAIGILEGATLTVIAYYFGSSVGSRLKDMR